MAVAVQPERQEQRRATSFSQLSTTCACGALSAVYFFDPFRGFCVEHAPSQQSPDRA